MLIKVDKLLYKVHRWKKMMVLLMIFPCFFFGQNFKEDMLALNKKLFGYKKFSITLHYKLFIDSVSNMPFEERHINMLKEDPNLFCKQEGLEFISNKEFQIMVDHRIKKIIINKTFGKTKDLNAELDFMKEKFDTLMLIYIKVVFVPVDKEIGSYDCYLKAGKYLRMQIFYNRKTNMPVKVIYNMRKKIQKNSNDKIFHQATLEVDYENFNSHPLVKQSDFSEKRFFYYENKTNIRLTASYSDYQIINHL